jgi:hypothetical protein
MIESTAVPSQKGISKEHHEKQEDKERYNDVKLGGRITFRTAFEASI